MSAEGSVRRALSALTCAALRIATSCIDETQTVQIYVDSLEQYLWYFERNVEAVRRRYCVIWLIGAQITAKHITSLVELISSQSDVLSSAESTQHPPPASASASAGLIEGVGTPDAILAAYRNTLIYIASRKEAAAQGEGSVGVLVCDR